MNAEVGCDVFLVDSLGKLCLNIHPVPPSEHGHLQIIWRLSEGLPCPWLGGHFIPVMGRLLASALTKTLNKLLCPRRIMARYSLAADVGWP